MDKNNSLKQDAWAVINAALHAARPDSAVREALGDFPEVKGRVVLIAIGKAAWQMAKAATEALGTARISAGVVITKYEHSMGDIAGLSIYEAGHPVPDDNSFAATDEVIKAVSGLTADDYVLFLVSGGGSALFEKPLVPTEELEIVTRQLLASGADITRINTIRKRLSAVKGGRFAEICAPASVFTVVLSDIIGDPLDMIASGPAYPDSSTSDDAWEIIRKYNIEISAETESLLSAETPKSLKNVTTKVTGSVRGLCAAARDKLIELGYSTVVLTDSLNCIAREAGSFLAAIARFNAESSGSVAFLAGGETVVKVTGTGKGGRNQEIALSAAEGIAGLTNTAVFSFGSDGTDGPTDAAGGYADGETWGLLIEKGMNKHLDNNDAYHALESVGGLIKTGPTGTNVNDLAVVLVKR